MSSYTATTIRALFAVLVLAMAGACTNGSTPGASTTETGLPAFDAAWDFNDPEATRETFRRMLAEHGDAAPAEWTLALKTQIARTHSLVGEFDAAHAILDEVERALPRGATRARLRYLLERGRTFNSDGDKSTAKPLFEEAWRIGREIGDDRLAVDAAHMVAIAVTGTAQANDWNLKGLELARASDDEVARNWVGPLTYNMGWEAFEDGNPRTALALFEESRQHFDDRDLPERERISRWSVARAKRELGMNDEALAMQLALEQENAAAGTEDGFVYEELGELYLLKGNEDKARQNFTKALALLEDVRWFVLEEPERLERIRTMAGDSSRYAPN